MVFRHPAAPRDYMPGVVFGGSGGGSSQPQTTTTQTVTKSEPWEGQKGYLTDVMAKAQQQYNSSNPQYFQGNTVIPMSDYTQQALQAQFARASAGSPVIDQATGEVGQTMGGAYLGQNPINQLANPTAQGQFLMSNPAFGQLGNMASGANLNNNPGNPLFGSVSQQAMNQSQVNQNLGDMASGAQVGGNPFLDQMFNSAASRVSEQYRNAIAPSTMATFEAAGQFGTEAYNQQRNLNEQGLGRGLSDMAAQMYGQAYSDDRNRQLTAGQALEGFRQQGLGMGLNAAQGMSQNWTNAQGQQLQAGGVLADQYARERANQMQAMGMIAQPYEAERSRMLAAAGMAPNLANADYLDFSKMLDVGASYEEQQQAELQAQIDRHNFEQNLPAWKLAQYGNLVQGNMGQSGVSTGTVQQPGYRSNRALGALGGAASGAMVGSAFGPWGTAIGAGVGGLAGLFG